MKSLREHPGRLAAISLGLLLCVVLTQLPDIPMWLRVVAFVAGLVLLFWVLLFFWWVQKENQSADQG